LKNVLADLARQISTTVEDDCEEYILDLPEKVGEGRIRGIKLRAGLGLIIYDCQFKQDVEIAFTVSEVHPAKFMYVTGGALRHRFQDEGSDQLHTINTYQSAIVASSRHGGHLLYFKAEERVQFCSLEILRAEFIKTLRCELNTLAQDLKEMLEDVKALNKFYYQSHYSLQLFDLFTQLRNYGETGVVKKIFLEAKVNEMLAYQLADYRHEPLKKNHNLRQKEIKALKKAFLYIDENLDSSLHIKEISRVSGLNANKLQQGFKITKGLTVNDYIRIQRLEHARALLHTSELSISEVVYKIGLVNRGYFSRLFKEEYGASPSEYRKKFSS